MFLHWVNLLRVVLLRFLNFKGEVNIRIFTIAVIIAFLALLIKMSFFIFDLIAFLWIDLIFILLIQFFYNRFLRLIFLRDFLFNFFISILFLKIGLRGCRFWNLLWGRQIMCWLPLKELPLFLSGFLITVRCLLFVVFLNVIIGLVHNFERRVQSWKRVWSFYAFCGLQLWVPNLPVVLNVYCYNAAFLSIFLKFFQSALLYIVLLF